METKTFDPLAVVPGDTIRFSGSHTGQVNDSVVIAVFDFNGKRYAVYPSTVGVPSVPTPGLMDLTFLSTQEYAELC